MLSLDVAFYGLFILITVSLTLYFVLLRKLKPSTEVKLSTYLERAGVQPLAPARQQRQPVNKRAKILQSSESPAIQTGIEAKTGHGRVERECPHYVGYLTTLPKGSSFPEECFGCRKVIRCMRIEPAGVIESFYVAPPEQNKL